MLEKILQIIILTSATRVFINSSLSQLSITHVLINHYSNPYPLFPLNPHTHQAVWSCPSKKNHTENTQRTPLLPKTLYIPPFRFLTNLKLYLIHYSLYSTNIYPCVFYITNQTPWVFSPLPVIAPSLLPQNQASK